MADYTKLTDFASKDALTTGNPAKIVKGTEINDEFVAIAAAITTKFDSTDLGVTVQAYDADTAKYDDAFANFTGTLQNGGSNVIVDTDIGVTVQAYDADIAKTDVAQTYTAAQKFLTIQETYATFTSTANAATVNTATATVFSHTLTENTTLTFSNPPATGTAYGMTIKIVQDAGASGFTVTWPASVDWAAATAPTLTATASAVDVFVFFTHDGGTTWYGFTAGKDMG